MSTEIDLWNEQWKYSPQLTLECDNCGRLWSKLTLFCGYCGIRLGENKQSRIIVEPETLFGGEKMPKKTIADIGWGDIDIYVDKQLVLHIGQVSDDKTINLFLYPKGDLIKSIMSEENEDSKCTHEILVERK